MGLTLGWGIVATWTDSLVPRWFMPLYGRDPDLGGYVNLLWILALGAGTMWYFIFTRRFKWIARIIIGFFIGVGAGIGIQGFFRLQLPQIAASFKSVWIKTTNKTGEAVLDLHAMFNNLVFLVTFYCTMAHFLFTFKRDRPVLKHAALAGRWLMMIAFGAMFGTTVMARLSLLIDRILFLLEDWLGLVG